MIVNYLQAAMRKAHYELLSDGEGVWGTIEGFHGLWANDKTLELTREKLNSALEDWVLFCVAKKFPLPEIDGVALTVKDVILPPPKPIQHREFIHYLSYLALKVSTPGVNVGSHDAEILA